MSEYEDAGVYNIIHPGQKQKVIEQLLISDKSAERSFGKFLATGADEQIIDTFSECFKVDQQYITSVLASYLYGIVVNCAIRNNLNFDGFAALILYRMTQMAHDQMDGKIPEKEMP